MKKVDIAGFHLDAGSKAEIVKRIEERIDSGRQAWMTTLYGEFLYYGLRNVHIKNFLNQADIAVADGIIFLFANIFLRQKLTSKSRIGKVLQNFWQMKLLLLQLLTHKSKFYQTFPERISGSEFIWDIAQLAVKNNYSVYLAGGRESVPEKAKQELQKRFPELRIVGTWNGSSDDPKLMQELQMLKPKILLVGFGPLKQEHWIANNRGQLPDTKFFIGLGGTFDYLAGAVVKPPALVQRWGLEWLFRLLTQPHRILRIKHAVPDALMLLYKYKLFNSLPLRPNACIVACHAGKILMCQRTLGQTPENFVPPRGVNGYWQLPQGGIELHETAIEGGARELYEETNLVLQQDTIRIIPVTHTYQWSYNPIRSIVKFLLGYEKAYSGQTQTVIFGLVENPLELRLDQREFRSAEWCTWEEALRITDPIRKPMVQRIYEVEKQRK